MNTTQNDSDALLTFVGNGNVLSPIELVARTVPVRPLSPRLQARLDEFRREKTAEVAA